MVVTLGITLICCVLGSTKRESVRHQTKNRGGIQVNVMTSNRLRQKTPLDYGQMPIVIHLKEGIPPLRHRITSIPSTPCS